MMQAAATTRISSGAHYPKRDDSLASSEQGDILNGDATADHGGDTNNIEKTILEVEKLRREKISHHMEMEKLKVKLK